MVQLSERYAIIKNWDFIIFVAGIFVIFKSSPARCEGIPEIRCIPTGVCFPVGYQEDKTIVFDNLGW